MAGISSILKKGLLKGKSSVSDCKKGLELTEKLDKPIADTELAIIPGLKKLITYFKK